MIFITAACTKMPVYFLPPVNMMGDHSHFQVLINELQVNKTEGYLGGPNFNQVSF